MLRRPLAIGHQSQPCCLSVQVPSAPITRTGGPEEKGAVPEYLPISLATHAPVTAMLLDREVGLVFVGSGNSTASLSCLNSLAPLPEAEGAQGQWRSDRS